jgi:hypothetical protein
METALVLAELLGIVSPVIRRSGLTCRIQLGGVLDKIPTPPIITVQRCATSADDSETMKQFKGETNNE